MIESIIPKGNIHFNKAGLLVTKNDFVRLCTPFKIVLDLIKEKQGTPKRLKIFALTKTAYGLRKKNCVLSFNKQLMNFPFLKMKN